MKKWLYCDDGALVFFPVNIENTWFDMVLVLFLFFSWVQNSVINYSEKVLLQKNVLKL